VRSGLPHLRRPRAGGAFAFAGIATLLMAVLATPLMANDTMPPAPYAYKQLEDPKQEAKAQALMETLRCLVCQGQSIADSDASMAGDMRNQVRLRIKAGEKPEAIRHWLMERYGDYISYKPVLSATTWPLFAVPAGLLLAAAAVFVRRFRRTR
jgi:cytochrome c-type biogenesis protein CcmH/NrfF